MFVIAAAAPAKYGLMTVRVDENHVVEDLE